MKDSNKIRGLVNFFFFKKKSKLYSKVNWMDKHIMKE